MGEIIWIAGGKEAQLEPIERMFTKNAGYHLQLIHSDAEVRALMASGAASQVSLIVWDVPSENAGAVAKLMREIHAIKRHLPILALIDYGDEASAETVIAAGAYDFLIKPVNSLRLQISVRNLLHRNHLSREISRQQSLHQGVVPWSTIIADSPVMQAVIAKAKSAAQTAQTLWLHGEKGTGKALLARAIHCASERGHKSFVVLNADDSALHEPEALRQKITEAADGTIYIQSVGALHPVLQRLMLDALATSPARIIYSSEASIGLPDATIELPPLRERKADIPRLARHFVRIHSASENCSVLGIHDDAVALLQKETWPGNIRQLSHLLFRAVMMCNQDILDAGTLRLVQQWEPSHFSHQPTQTPSLVNTSGGVRSLRDIEEDAIVHALRASAGSMTRAAKSLGIGRSTLYRRVNELGLEAYMPRLNQITPPIMSAS